MVFNATFNNTELTSWQSVLLVEEARENGKWLTELPYDHDQMTLISS
jgi:hypothetical protein